MVSDFARKSIVLLTLVFVSVLCASAVEATEKKDTLATDSADFIKASVLVARPANAFHSNLGHSAIRLQCPAYNLDFCFSFLVGDGFEDIIRFFAGKAEGRIVAVASDVFISDYARNGRGVEQYTLNLTHHEKQRLWQLLDNDNVAPENRKFNFITNNCTSSALISIQDAMLEGDSICYAWPENVRDVDNAMIMRYITRDMPWMQFLCMVLFGTEGEGHWDNIHRMAPDLLKTLLDASTIVNKGVSRPVLIGQTEMLVPHTADVSPIWLTPTRLFGIVFVLVLLLSLAQWKWRLKRTAQVMDIILLLFQTIAGILLCYMTVQVGLLGKHWNWLLVPFNPLPAVFWLLWHRRPWWHRIYLYYTIVLVLFIIYAGLFLSTFIPSIAFLVATYAVRCAAKYIIFMKEAKPSSQKH